MAEGMVAEEISWADVDASRGYCCSQDCEVGSGHCICAVKMLCC